MKLFKNTQYTVLLIIGFICYFYQTAMNMYAPIGVMKEFMANGDFYKRNQMLLTKVLQEKEYNLTDKEISELNEMSILIFRGMLETMRIDKNKPTLAQAVHRTVQYLENTLRVYHLV